MGGGRLILKMGRKNEVRLMEDVRWPVKIGGNWSYTTLMAAPNRKWEKVFRTINRSSLCFGKQRHCLHTVHDIFFITV